MFMKCHHHRPPWPWMTARTTQTSGPSCHSWSWWPMVAYGGYLNLSKYEAPCLLINKYTFKYLKHLNLWKKRNFQKIHNNSNNIRMFSSKITYLICFCPNCATMFLWARILYVMCFEDITFHYIIYALICTTVTSSYFVQTYTVTENFTRIIY